MTECSLSWWQTEQGVTLLIFILSAIFGVIGWFFKTWWESRKPYKRDKETFERIKSLFDGGNNYLIQNLKFFCVGEPIAKNDIDKLHRINDITFQEADLLFTSKKVQRKLKRLIKNTKLFVSAFFDPYELIGNNYILYKHPNCYRSEFERIEQEELRNKRCNILYCAQNRFISSYDDFIKMATKELYKERIN